MSDAGTPGASRELGYARPFTAFAFSFTICTDNRSVASISRRLDLDIIVGCIDGDRRIEWDVRTGERTRIMHNIIGVAEFVLNKNVLLARAPMTWVGLSHILFWWIRTRVRIAVWLQDLSFSQRSIDKMEMVSVDLVRVQDKRGCKTKRVEVPTNQGFKASGAWAVLLTAPLLSYFLSISLE